MNWNLSERRSWGQILWWASLLSLAAGIAALWQGGELASVSFQTWYWTALVGGVLALGLK